MEKLTTQYPADALAEALEVSKSGFAGHRAKPRRSRRRQDAELRPLIAQSFAESRRTRSAALRAGFTVVCGCAWICRNSDIAAARTGSRG